MLVYWPVSAAICHLLRVYHAAIYIGHSARPCSTSRCNESWRRFRPPLGKKPRVLCRSGQFYYVCWHTVCWLNQVSATMAQRSKLFRDLLASANNSRIFLGKRPGNFQAGAGTMTCVRRMAWSTHRQLPTIGCCGDHRFVTVDKLQLMSWWNTNFSLQWRLSQQHNPAPKISSSRRHTVPPPTAEITNKW